MPRVTFDPEAADELQKGVDYYEDSRPGLGLAFLDEIEAATRAIARHPLLWRKMRGQFRRYLLKRFPYALIYVAAGDTLYVVAVMHLRRKPGYWTSRTRKKRPE